jgi:putative transcriptional regulator
MAKRRAKYEWDAESIKALREHMGLSQQALADELEMRQQTISEWETGLYKPRRSTGKYLTLIAERAGFEYTVGGERREKENAKEGESEAEP